MNSSKIRLLLADSHSMVRTALRLFLEREGMEIVGEAKDGREAVELSETLAPDIVILEIALPLLNGIEVVRRIKRRSIAATKALVCSAYSNDEYIWKLTALRVDGYVLKQNPAADLVRAIREISDGKAFFSPEIVARMLERYQPTSSNGASSQPAEQYIDLTFREAEVLQLIAEGKPNKQIADTLCISIKTVEKHRQQVMNKLGIHDIAGLTRYALEHGLLVPNEFEPKEAGI